MSAEHVHRFEAINPPITLAMREAKEIGLPFTDAFVAWQLIGTCECGAREVRGKDEKDETNYSVLNHTWVDTDGPGYSTLIQRIAGDLGFPRYGNSNIISAGI